MGFNSEFKISLYHKCISETLEKNTRFPKLASFSVLVMYVPLERLYATKLAVAFFEVYIFSNILIL